MSFRTLQILVANVVLLLFFYLKVNKKCTTIKLYREHNEGYIMFAFSATILGSM